ncbi:MULTISPECIES: hypothetical protein [unclassified Streptomyces]
MLADRLPRSASNRITYDDPERPVKATALHSGTVVHSGTRQPRRLG